MPAQSIARRQLLQAFGAATFLWPLANRVFADTSSSLHRLSTSFSSGFGPSRLLREPMWAYGFLKVMTG